MKFTAGGLLAVAGIALLLVALTPGHAYAWGPGTHAYLSWQVLQSLQLLPEAMRTVLAAYPHDFIYGSLATDISLAKKYVPEGRHCHHWHVGEEIEAAAGSERLKAVGIGYLTHLAADPVELTFSQHSQQARLQLRGHVTDLIEEQCAAVGLLEATTTQVIGAGE